MDLNDFNWNYLNKLLENIFKEQKSIFLLGNFNDNLLNYNEHNETNDPYARAGVPKKVKNMNVKVFDLMSGVNETRLFVQHELC